MRKWAFSLLLLLAPAAFAQTAAVQNHCYQGGTKAQVSGLSSTNFQQGIVPSCQVKVFFTGTQTLAPIYAAAGGTGSVSGVTITAGGNYSVCPTSVTFSGGGGSGAAGTPVCAQGSVTSVNMTLGGNGYASAPAVGFAGGTGSGAVGTATLSTPLSNPFTANVAGSLDAGGWIFWAAVNKGYDVVMSGGVAPNVYAQPITLTDIFPSSQFSGGSSGGAANIGHVQQILSGDNAGNAIGMPEEGTNLIHGSPNTATVAWKEDGGLGQFDARDIKYAGGILGGTPGLAMQALADDIVCYQSLTGLHANVTFPPGIFRVGTAAKPTLNLPTGAYYRGAAGNYNGTSTTFQASYNNVLAIHFAISVSATCSDGNVHTNSLTAGKYVGIGESGCVNVSCSNVSGDTNTYVFGGPHQDSIKIEDSQGFVDLLGASNNGGNGVEVGGQDTEVRTLWGFGNMAWYYFGHTQPGQAYNPTTDGWHCNVMLTGLDNTNVGPFETYGILQTPGAEYMHLCSAYWGGGNTHMGPVFSNRDQIGLVRDTGFSNGRALGGRYDGPMGEAIYNAGAVNTFDSIENATACSGFSTTPKGTVFGPYLATLGNGMTNSTYVVPANTGDATLTVVVSGGKASTITVSNAGTTGEYTSTPTFTMTGTGGTPATIGATTYQHCDYIDDEGTFGGNSYVNVRNDYLAFFGTDNSTGRIWSASPFNTYDRGTTGEFERQAVDGVINQPKGVGQHKDVLDQFQPSGGVGVTGPAVNFSGGNHFFSTDATPTNWSGPFTVSNIMQDLWIMCGNANTTLRVQDGWVTRSGHDLNLACPLTGPVQYHFIVFRDDLFFTIGTNFLFAEQGDPIFEDYLQPGFAWLAANSALPATNTQATLDIAGSAAVRPYPALPALTIIAAGSGSAFTYCIVTEWWVAGGKQTSASVCNSHTPPVTSTSMDNFQVHQAPPQNWTRYQVRLNSTTDGSFTPGVWFDVSAPNGLPQPANSDFGGGASGLFITKKVPTDTTTIATPNLSLNMTGTYNVSLGGVAVPATSATLCIKGQVIRSVSGGFDYVCDAEDHWKRAAVTWANF